MGNIFFGLFARMKNCHNNIKLAKLGSWSFYKIENVQQNFTRLRTKLAMTAFVKLDILTEAEQELNLKPLNFW